MDLSGLTRAFSPAEEAFLKDDGFSLLMRSMQGSSDKLVAKAAFMLWNMLVSNPSYKGTYVRLYAFFIVIIHQVIELHFVICRISSLKLCQNTVFFLNTVILFPFIFRHSI